MMRYVILGSVFFPPLYSWSLVSARQGAWVWVIFWSWFLLEDVFFSFFPASLMRLVLVESIRGINKYYSKL